MHYNYVQLPVCKKVIEIDKFEKEMSISIGIYAYLEKVWLHESIRILNVHNCKALLISGCL